MKTIKGIIPPMITPLKGDDQIDREGTVRLTEHILAGGVHALFLLGTTGEAQSLSYECRYDFVELVCRQVAGRVPVLVGVTDTSLDESVKLAAHAAKCGAVAVVAAAPYYFAPSQQELIEYYTALADALPLPLFLYNMPSHVKVFLEPATVKTLAEHPNIVGLKDSSANMTYFQTLLYHLGDREDFALYVGPEELTGESVVMGADGGVNGGANIFPELYVQIYYAACNRDVNTMRALQRKIMQISTSLYTVGKYGSSVQTLLKKLSGLPVKTICPLHGPVLTGDLSAYLEKYDVWSSYRPTRRFTAIPPRLRCGCGICSRGAARSAWPSSTLRAAIFPAPWRTRSATTRSCWPRRPTTEACSRRWRLFFPA